MRESSLWKWLRDGAPDGAMLERIENSVSRGTPDVLGTYAGGTFVCELKVAKTAHGVVSVALTPRQADFAIRWCERGGLSWILIRVGSEHHLVHGRHAIRLLEPINYPALDVMSRATGLMGKSQSTVTAHDLVVIMAAVRHGEAGRRRTALDDARQSWRAKAK